MVVLILRLIIGVLAFLFTHTINRIRDTVYSIPHELSSHFPTGNDPLWSSRLIAVKHRWNDKPPDQSAEK